MHCRSFFDRCCAHCCCARFLVLSVTVLGPVGGAPGQGWGGPRASRACFWWPPWKPPLCPGSPAKDGDGCAASLAGKKSRVSILGERKASSQNARHGVYEWKTALVFALRMHSSQPLQLEPAVCRRKLEICYPAKDSLLERRGRRAPATQNVVGGRSGHSAPSSRGDAAG